MTTHVPKGPVRVLAKPARQLNTLEHLLQPRQWRAATSPHVALFIWRSFEKPCAALKEGFAEVLAAKSCQAVVRFLNVGMTFAGCGHDLPESTLQCKHELFQVNPMRKPVLAQNTIGVWISPVMPGAKRYRREVRGLLPHPSPAQGVGVRRFDNGGPAAHAGTNYAWKRLDPGQVIRISSAFELPVRSQRDRFVLPFSSSDMFRL